jgi:uncharacterized protein (TIGR00299 family) protein
MVLGALLDAGAPLSGVIDAIDRLGIDCSIEVEPVLRGGVRATHALVTAPDRATERRYGDVVDLIRSARLAEPIERRALRAFEILGRAEAKIHGVKLDRVHLHEVGATDAIVDIVGASAALAFFDPDRVVTSAIPTGRGLVQSAHGSLPLPAPAVVEILEGAVLFERGDQETITPTGAALLKAFSDEFGELPPLRVASSGNGAGTRDSTTPNITRVIVGDEIDLRLPAPTHLVVECNVDDMSPELLPHVVESLFEAGAQDAWITPVVMKKGRPAFTISALVEPIHRWHVMEILYRETTTLGVRSTAVSKDELDRNWVEVEVEGHPVRVKLGIKSGDVVSAAPEYDDALAVARATGLPLKQVYATALRALEERDLTP